MGDGDDEEVARNRPRVKAEEPGWFPALTTYLGYTLLIIFGHIRDFFGKITGQSRYFGGNSAPRKGFAPLLQDWENFYTRRLYHRIQDCWSRPIAGPPFANKMAVMDREVVEGTYYLRPTGEVHDMVNLGSYNYLGFADDWRETCRDAVVGTLRHFGVSMCASVSDGATSALQEELNQVVARFLNKPAAITYGMGYGTNTTVIPALTGPGCLILSDALNHTSIVNGARHSGAVVRVFKHNDARHLEKMLREAIIAGQPLTARPWKKILVVVEGIYSMEGEVCDLRSIVRTAKKYKAFVMLDEAHSIGALGATGRGACEHCGVDTSEIDVLMGTFTKSFGAMGGYIAGSRALIAYLRANSSQTIHGTAMSPVVASQILRAFEIIEGRDGTAIGADKLRRVKDNANYFRRRLLDMGCQVFGDWDSPVVPMMLYNPAKIAAFSRECYKRGLAVVVVGFPATSLIESRTRFCVSAGHTKETLDSALERIHEVVTLLRLRYKTHMLG